MKSFRNYKHQAYHSLWMLGLIAFFASLGVLSCYVALSHASVARLLSTSHSQPFSREAFFEHQNIVTTVFWVGEPADRDNGFISNIASAWDDHWQAHYGGVDSPDRRNGYLPADFVPKENPFYVALPYSDIRDSGDRKQSASECQHSTAPSPANYSWCKNTWIRISHGDKTVYAQWEDVGPFEEDDTAYVFGRSAPKNRQNPQSGLDVSPAIQTYLGLQDVDVCSWQFVAPSVVPQGPWTTVTTVNTGDPING